MIFLIEYDRAQGRIINLRKFDQSDRVLAEDTRLDLELALSRQEITYEVVLLEAANEEALRKTHRRYFETLDQLTTPVPAER